MRDLLNERRDLRQAQRAIERIAGERRDSAGDREQQARAWPRGEHDGLALDTGGGFRLNADSLNVDTL